MECKNIEKSREILIKKLYKYWKSGRKNHIKLDIDKELFQQILFKDNRIAIPDNLWKLLDLSGVSFDGISVTGADFKGSKVEKMYFDKPEVIKKQMLIK